MRCLSSVRLLTASISKLISELREWKVCVTWSSQSPQTDRVGFCERGTLLMLGWVCDRVHGRVQAWLLIKLGLRASSHLCASGLLVCEGIEMHCWEWVFTTSILEKAFLQPTVGNSRHNFAVFWLFALYRDGSRSLWWKQHKDDLLTHVAVRMFECGLGNGWFLNSNVLPRCLRILCLKHQEFQKM